MAADPTPVTLAQERIWFHDQLQPESIAYNRPAPLRLTGPLRVSALRRALRDLLQRHEVLNGRIDASAGRPWLVVCENDEFDLPLKDCSDTPDAVASAKDLALQEARRPFDLAAGPLVRGCLFRLGDQDHLLLLVFHHLVFDAWSETVLVRDLAALYEARVTGQTARLSVLPIHYTEYALEEQQPASQASMRHGLAYWRSQLEGSRPLQLSSPAPQGGIGGPDCGRCSVSLPLRGALRAFAVREQTTPFAILLAVYAIVLARYFDERDLVIGCPYAGRTRVDLENLIGLFINTLPLRVDLTGDPTFRELVQQTSRTTWDALAHQHVPLQWIVRDVSAPLDRTRGALFDVLFVYENLGLKSAMGGAVTFTPSDIDIGAAPVSLALELREGADGSQGHLEYRRERWSASFIAQMANHFTTLTQHALTEPERPVSQLSMLSGEERRRLLVQWPQSGQYDVPAMPIHGLVEAQAKRTPTALAVEEPDTRRALTYAELDRRANAVARRCRDAGVLQGMRVVLFGRRSIETLIGMLGVLKAGAAFVPLSPEAPADHLSRVIRDCQPTAYIGLPEIAHTCGLGDRPCVAVDAEAPAGERAEIVVGPKDVAYVIYTSGSTGVPNGVEVEHGAVVNYCLETCRLYELSAEDRVAQLAALTFDMCIEEIFPAWISGGTVVLKPEALPLAGSEFWEGIQRLRIHVLSLPTAAWHAICDALVELPQGVSATSVRLIAVGGEQIQTSRLERWHQRVGGAIRLLNTYGPTETTVIATVFDVTAPTSIVANRPVPIGRPLRNVLVYVLADTGQPAPVDLPGELYIGGDGLARGYLNRPELTAQRFVSNPFVGDSTQRLYRTGDRVRWRDDGQLEFLGRVDRQVKVRGFRVEPGEVEDVLRQHPDVADAHVLPGEDASRNVALEAFIVCRPGGESQVHDLRSFAAERLPAYMVPAAFAIIDSMPLTRHGKIDQGVLRSLQSGKRRGGMEAEPPTTVVEKQLAEIWQEVLDVERVSATDRFVYLGGHSLSALQVLNRITSVFGVKVSLVSLLEGSTLRELALVVEAELSK